MSSIILKTSIFVHKLRFFYIDLPLLTKLLYIHTTLCVILWFMSYHAIEHILTLFTTRLSKCRCIKEYSSRYNNFLLFDHKYFYDVAICQFVKC